MLRPFAYLAGRQSSPSIRHPFLQPEQRQTLSLKSKENTKQNLIPIKIVNKEKNIKNNTISVLNDPVVILKKSTVGGEIRENSSLSYFLRDLTVFLASLKCILLSLTIFGFISTID